MASRVGCEGRGGQSPLLRVLGERCAIWRRAVSRAAGWLRRPWCPSAIWPIPEYGTGNLHPAVLQQIAHALQCSMAELLGDGDDGHAPNGCCCANCWKAHAAEADFALACDWLPEILGTRTHRRSSAPGFAHCLTGLRRGEPRWAYAGRATGMLPFLGQDQEIERVAGCSCARSMTSMELAPVVVTSAPRTRRGRCRSTAMW